MGVSDRRAPRKVYRFRVVKPFRYARREYDPEAEGRDEIDVRHRGVPRHRVDKMWRDGLIETFDGQACTREVPQEEEEEIVEEEAPEETEESEDDEE